MKETNHVSQLKLELYHMGLASAKERKLVEAALASDKELSERYEAIKQSDQELDHLADRFLRNRSRRGGVEQFRRRKLSGSKLGLGVAAILLCIAIPTFLYLRGHSSNAGIETAQTHELEEFGVGGGDREFDFFALPDTEQGILLSQTTDAIVEGSREDFSEPILSEGIHVASETDREGTVAVPSPFSGTMEEPPLHQQPSYIIPDVSAIPSGTVIAAGNTISPPSIDELALPTDEIEQDHVDGFPDSIFDPDRAATIAAAPGSGTRGGGMDTPQLPSNAPGLGTRFTELIIPPQVTEIENNAYANWPRQSVVIHDRVRSIGNNAFIGVPVLRITIGPNVSIRDNSFPGNFSETYARYGAGTYTRSDINSSNWIKHSQ